MSKQRNKIIIGLLCGSILIVIAFIILLYNINLYVERGARDADTMYEYVCAEAEQRYGDGQKQPVVMKKEKEPILVYFGYASYLKKGYYAVYTTSAKYEENHLWIGPKEEGELTLEEGEKKIEVETRKNGKYQVLISFTEEGRPEIAIEKQP